MILPYKYNIAIDRSVDGDTLDVYIDLGFDIKMRERVRLYYVDTPEIFGPKAKTEGEEGKKAHAVTDAWIAGGKTFLLDSVKYDARDKYGRCLGIVYRDDDPVSLNDVLKAAGYGAS